MARRQQTARKSKAPKKAKLHGLVNGTQVNGVEKPTRNDNRLSLMNCYRPTALVLSGIRLFGAARRRVGNGADNMGKEILFARRIRGFEA
jgi:hypothetical protein